MPDLKFGLLPGYVPAALKDLTHYAAGDLPTAPPKVDVPEVPAQDDGTPWGVDGNAEYGDCGVAGLDHLFMAVASATAESETWPTADEIVQYYLSYTGGKDSGVVLADFLAYVKAKEFFTHTVKAYAPVSVHDIPTMHYAINAYGAAYTGIAVTQAMQQAFAEGKAWDLDDLLSPVAGGHCIPIVGYDSSALYAVTWGKVQPITHSAWHFMSSEAWAVIPGEITAKGDDGRGINLAALEADLAKLSA